jgi:HTH-type transcriptional regulator, glycine betaine synthesis regulator
MNQVERNKIKKHIVDACVQAASRKGRCDAAGVLHGTLFLADEPMSLDELVEETGYSKSTVSSNMSVLDHLGLAKRIITPGDKRYRYLLEIDHDAMRSTLLNNVKEEIRLMLVALEATEKELMETSSDPKNVARIVGAKEFYLKARELLDLVLRYSTEELIDLLKPKAP